MTESTGAPPICYGITIGGEFTVTPNSSILLATRMETYDRIMKNSEG
jgi:hypothetical protein